MTHFILKDGSHGIVKISLNSFPVTWIEQGAYCSVIGSITSSWQTPLIEAIKVTKLDNSLYLQRLWEWEVKDLANELCNKK
uniref:Uncharacterized protein n=1 Tax=Daphnia galeata TaxID=27404 RepID=A0A8J2RHV5_9CRUS|nr:unnamed protein product [Daphnia galeata]